MEVITDNTATLANALARIAELEAEREQALKREPICFVPIKAIDKLKESDSFATMIFSDTTFSDCATLSLYLAPIPVQPSPAVAVLPHYEIRIDDDGLVQILDHKQKRSELIRQQIVINYFTELSASSIPTPPSAEQDEKSEAGKAMNWDYYQELLKQNGFSGITDLLTKYHALERSVEQPGSATPKPRFWYCETSGVDSCLFEEDDLADNESLPLKPLYLHSATDHKPQRITEQDAREIAESFGASLGSMPVSYVHVDTWLENKGLNLLDKLNEHREPDYKAQRDLLLSTIKPALDFVRCGIGGNYSGTNYEPKMEQVYYPLNSAIAQCEGESK